MSVNKNKLLTLIVLVFFDAVMKRYCVIETYTSISIVKHAAFLTTLNLVVACWVTKNFGIEPHKMSLSDHKCIFFMEGARGENLFSAILHNSIT